MLGRPHCRIQAPLPSEVPRALSLRSRINWHVLLSLQAVWYVRNQPSFLDAAAAVAAAAGSCVH